MNYGHLSQDLTREDYVPLSEHQSSTPASFSLEDNVVCYFESPVTVSCPHANATQQAKIYVLTTSVALWLDSGAGVTIPYQKMLLHAIQKGDGNGSSSSQVYIQLDGGLPLFGQESAPNGSDVSSDDAFTELMITTPTESGVDTLFAALSACAALHPDPDSDDDALLDSPMLPLGDFSGDADMSGDYPDGAEGEEGVGGWAHHEKILTPTTDHASLAVEIENEIRAGIVRPREGSEEMDSKWRKME